MEREYRGAAVALLAATLICVVPPVARADERGPNPQIVFNQVHAAYLEERSHAAAVRAEQHYFSAIVNAGRAYARLRPNDSEYGKLATLTVQIGTQLHYNPLTNGDAAPWWVREAALWVSKNSKNIQLVRGANELVVRVDAMNVDLQMLAKYADEDATALLREHPRDTGIRLIQAEADWRAWLLTNDTSWRDRAFAHAAQVGVAATELPKAIARVASNDIAALAPADEYFGRMNYSILGMENTIKNLNRKIDGGEDAAGQESLALLVADSLCDMQKTYPADHDLTQLLYNGYTLLNRVGTPPAITAAAKFRTLLTIEYQDTPQAAQLLEKPRISASVDSASADMPDTPP